MKDELKAGVNPLVSVFAESFDVDVKRFYMPGVSVVAQCPDCGKVITKSYTRDYLSYPKAGEPFVEHLYCEGLDGKQDHQFAVRLVLKVALEVAP